MNNHLNSFLKKIASVSDILNLGDNKKEVLKNLTASFFINFSRLMSSDEKVAPFLTDYSQASDSNPSKLFEFLDSKGVDYQQPLADAQNETLNNFVLELEANLPPEKIAELKKVISE